MENPPIQTAGGSAVLLAGRLLLAAIFLHEGTTLALHFNATAEAFEKLGLELPIAVCVILLQLGAGLSVAVGFLTRLGAIALGLFCLSTALLFHTLFGSQNELLHFEKDFAIAGGMFVLAVTGAGRFSIDALLKQNWRGMPAVVARLL